MAEEKDPCVSFMKGEIMKKQISLIVLVTLLTAVFCFAGCSSKKSTSNAKLSPTKDATTYPLTISDDLGNAVTFDAAPTKVVSLAPANTEIICGVDGINLLVGRSDYCNYPAEVSKVDSIGDYYAPNTEKIIGLKPDLVFAAEYMDDSVRSQLENAGIKVFILKAAGVDDTVQDILKVAQILNKNDKASALVEEMETERAALKEVCKKAETKRSVFIDLGEYFSAGDGSLMDSMLQEINAKNIAAGTGDNVPQLSTEQIIKANPDVYISFFSTADEIKAVPGFDAINAVKNNAVTAFGMVSTEGDMMQRSGPRIVKGMQELAKVVYPELFQ